MFAPAHDFFRAINQARRATRAGDSAAADRWMRIAERHLKIAGRFDQLAAPASPPTASAGPVMLDSKGFSPGGTPNWFLNQKRRERAGLA